MNRTKAAVVTMLDGAGLSSISTCQARSTGCEMKFWVSKGGLLRPVEVWTTIGAPVLNAPLCG